MQEVFGNSRFEVKFDPLPPEYSEGCHPSRKSVRIQAPSRPFLSNSSSFLQTGITTFKSKRSTSNKDNKCARVPPRHYLTQNPIHQPWTAPCRQSSSRTRTSRRRREQADDGRPRTTTSRRHREQADDADSKKTTEGQEPQLADDTKNKQTTEDRDPVRAGLARVRVPAAGPTTLDPLPQEDDDLRWWTVVLTATRGARTTRP